MSQAPKGEPLNQFLGRLFATPREKKPAKPRLAGGYSDLKPKKRA
jgi:hypothetical protein